MELIAYFDADWCGDKQDRKSTSGLLIVKPLIPLLPGPKNNKGNKKEISIECSFDDKRKEK